MSDTANWAYTGRATIWKATGTDDWTQQVTFAAPVVIACSYKGEVITTSGTIGGITNAAGAEFVSKTTYYTEYADAARGDFIAIGVHTSVLPVYGADMVKAVERIMDMDNVADDYQVIT